jgi:D-alanyl-lipoteichoic acid acyltransferase DltB (MBOAT superfamily)
MVRDIVLPIGISFFTFQQIAYVIDVWRQRIKVGDLLSYAVFVTFFPQLIAGPIVRYQEIVPQLYQKLALGRYFAAGIFLFVIGLLKKVVVADNLAQPANSIFDAVERGSGIGFDDAWLGALAYTFQLYFDFSAYSDMALGIGLMLGLRLPVNFDSPYKARSIVEFWRRWHMTLSSFFRDYLYIFLGGNRHGPLRQLGALLVVMGLVGLWHGAGWTFVLWGLYHGVLLMGAHVFAHGRRLVGGAVGWRVHRWHELARIASGMSWVIEWGTTFVLVVLGWVIFRAANLGVAEHMLGAMISPTRAPDTRLLLYDARYVAAWGMIVGSFVICMLLPNAVRIAGVGLSSDSFFHRGNQVRPVGVPVWMRPTEMSYGLVALLAVAFYFACTTMLTTTSEFIYFQF